MMYGPDFNSYQRQLDEMRKDFGNLVPLQPSPIKPHQVQSCKGIKEAKKIQELLPPGGSEIIVDENEEVFYIAVKDEKGHSPDLMMIGHYTLEQESAPESPYVTKEDFAAFEQRIMKLLTKEDKHE